MNNLQQKPQVPLCKRFLMLTSSPKTYDYFWDAKHQFSAKEWFYLKPVKRFLTIAAKRIERKQTNKKIDLECNTA